MSVTPLTYQNVTARRRWRAKWLVLAVLLTAGLASIRAWPMVWRRANLVIARIELSRVHLPADQLVVDAKGKVLIPPPRAWLNFYRAYEGAGSAEKAVLYLDWRTSPNGHRHLIEVGCYHNQDGSSAGLSANWISFDLGNVLPITEPRQTTSEYSEKFIYAIGSKFFTGVSDPSDPSHFTLQIKGSGQDWVENCYLMNSGFVRVELCGGSKKGSISARP